MKKEKLMEYAEKFVDSEVLPRCHLEIIEEINRHKKEGRMVILNTASPDIYPAIISKRLGFDDYRATRFILEEKSPLFIRIDGKNNKRFEKLLSMSDLLPPEYSAKILSHEYKYQIPDADPVIKNSWAYSDSTADLPMLLLSENKILVNPVSSQLKDTAHEKLWDIVNPGKCREAFCRYGQMLLQILGLFPLI